jgi:hypothetical protein
VTHRRAIGRKPKLSGVAGQLRRSVAQPTLIAHTRAVKTFIVVMADAAIFKVIVVCRTHATTTVVLCVRYLHCATWGTTVSTDTRASTPSARRAAQEHMQHFEASEHMRKHAKKRGTSSHVHQEHSAYQLTREGRICPYKKGSEPKLSLQSTDLIGDFVHGCCRLHVFVIVSIEYTHIFFLAH